MSGSNSVVATNGAEPVEGAPRPRVLMVDDQPDNLMALAALEPLDAELVPARSGEEALRHLLGEEFAVIVLGVQMPVLDGFEIARLIKQREWQRAELKRQLTDLDRATAALLSYAKAGTEPLRGEQVAEHPSEERPGHGVGLAVCRRIVERHGGSIHAEPAPGGGTSIVFTLPSSGLTGSGDGLWRGSCWSTTTRTTACWSGSPSRPTIATRSPARRATAVRRSPPPTGNDPT
jgi:CheY-like chemotaxis protein